MSFTQYTVFSLKVLIKFQENYILSVRVESSLFILSDLVELQNFAKAQ